eukprot:2102518-Amphidinium_carterae.1
MNTILLLSNNTALRFDRIDYNVIAAVALRTNLFLPLHFCDNAMECQFAHGLSSPSSHGPSPLY